MTKEYKGLNKEAPKCDPVPDNIDSKVEAKMKEGYNFRNALEIVMNGTDHMKDKE